MPTYSYTCKNCGHAFDAYQSFDEASLVTCPECHEDTLRKVWGAVGGVQFKGSGFYSTSNTATAGGGSTSGGGCSSSGGSSSKDS